MTVDQVRREDEVFIRQSSGKELHLQGDADTDADTWRVRGYEQGMFGIQIPRMGRRRATDFNGDGKEVRETVWAGTINWSTKARERERVAENGSGGVGEIE